ncbi:MAG: hypothetical protein RLY41_1336 [Pseudomonadota bacterium]
MQQPQPVTDSESEAEVLPTVVVRDTTGLAPRALWGTVALVVLSVGSLAWAWLWPDFTLLHFLWVAQAVPLLYVFLAWWGTQPASTSDDAPI